jgi:hypothetical protein
VARSSVRSPDDGNPPGDAVHQRPPAMRSGPAHSADHRRLLGRRAGSERACRPHQNRRCPRCHPRNHGRLRLIPTRSPAPPNRCLPGRHRISRCRQPRPRNPVRCRQRLAPVQVRSSRQRPICDLSASHLSPAAPSTRASASCGRQAAARLLPSAALSLTVTT